MTSVTRTPDDIERDIEDERARLSSTINNLQEKFSVEGIVGDLGDMFRNQGGDMTRAISGTVGRNPAAVALVSVGLAWLFLGPNRMDQDHKRAQRTSGPARGKGPGRQYSNVSDGYERADEGSWFEGPADSASSWSDDGGRVASQQNRIRPLTSGAAATGTGAAVAGAVRSGVDTVTGVVVALGEEAVGLKDRLMQGTEGFSDDAKARVRSARQAAIDAKDAAEAALGRGRNAAADMFANQPLVLGALAVAMGAAIGGILPHSRIEDDTLGASRDRLFDEAMRAFEEESARASSAARHPDGNADKGTTIGAQPVPTAPIADQGARDNAISRPVPNGADPQDAVRQQQMVERTS